MSGEFRFSLRGLNPRALGLERPLGLAQRAIGALGRGRQRFEPAIGVDQRAMGRRVGQRALVVLAVDLDQRRSQPPQRLGADASIIDIGAGAPVGELDPPQDQLVADLNVLPFEERMGGVSLANSNVAVTWPCDWPWRTRPPSPRAPSASDSASRRMDFPAPVSPVRMVSPGENSRSS